MTYDPGRKPPPDWAAIAREMRKNLAENPAMKQSPFGFTPQAGSPLGRVTGRLAGQLEHPIVLDMDLELATPWWRRPWEALRSRIEDRIGFWEYVGSDFRPFGDGSREYGAKLYRNNADAELSISAGRRNWRWEWRVWNTSDRR